MTAAPGFVCGSASDASRAPHRRFSEAPRSGGAARLPCGWRHQRDTPLGSGTFNATHDAFGNMLAMPGRDASRFRHRRPIEAPPYGRASCPPAEPPRRSHVRKSDTLYLGGFELVRTWTGTEGTDLDDEIETLHVMDADARLAIVETQTVEAGDAVPTPDPKWRYQLDDLIGSSAVELGRDGQVISYEEFHPYGTTALLIDTGGEGFRKRYRWSGKERDAESGLVYFGARYFAPWLGRWASADPAGAVDGNPYRVVRGNPVGLREVDGRQGAAGATERQSYDIMVGLSAGGEPARWVVDSQNLDWIQVDPVPLADAEATLPSLVPRAGDVAGVRVERIDGAYHATGYAEPISAREYRDSTGVDLEGLLPPAPLSPAEPEYYNPVDGESETGMVRVGLNGSEPWDAWEQRSGGERDARRQSYQVNIPLAENRTILQREGWRQLSWGESYYHQYESTPGQWNTKWVHEDGREAVYGYDGRLITNGPDRGSYNYSLDFRLVTPNLQLGGHARHDVGPFYADDQWDASTGPLDRVLGPVGQRLYGPWNPWATTE